MRRQTREDDQAGRTARRRTAEPPRRQGAPQAQPCRARVLLRDRHSRRTTCRSPLRLRAGGRADRLRRETSRLQPAQADVRSSSASAFVSPTGVRLANEGVKSGSLTASNDTGSAALEAESPFELHTHRTFDKQQVLLNEKRRRAALLQSPLPDSNRRPPPYHVIRAATGGNPR